LAGPLSASARTSEASAFLDAIAAGDFATADEIARRSTHVWTESDEYEEDFLFYEFLMVHAAPGAPVGEATKLLDRWEKCLAGTDDTRLPVCRALIEADRDAFDRALIDYLDAREREQREQLPMLEPEAAATEASVSIEGLGLRQIAARRGLAPLAEHAQMPLPLAEPSTDWPVESFRTID
jgi:hypothetical protein